MIISHKYKFIFVKNRKVAGSSFQACIGKHCGRSDIFTVSGDIPSQNTKGVWNPCGDILLAPNWETRFQILSDFIHFNKFKPHMGARLIQARIPKKTWDSYFKFCIERNPWDKTLSFYHMKKHNPDFTNMSFESFLSRCPSLCSDFDRYSDVNGNIIVDRILRYESLLSDLSDLCEKLGIPFNGDLGFKINSQFRNDRRDYRDVYTNSQKQIVKNVYKKEIEIMGYEF
jgi:hypothetical protein